MRLNLYLRYTIATGNSCHTFVLHYPLTPIPCLMPVATLNLELSIEHAHSLKDRRQVVRSLKDKLRHNFNVSVAELDESVVYNRATIGIVAISSSPSYLAGQLREVEDAARRIALGLGCEILDSFIETDTM